MLDQASNRGSTLVFNPEGVSWARWGPRFELATRKRVARGPLPPPGGCVPSRRNPSEHGRRLPLGRWGTAEGTGRPVGRMHKEGVQWVGFQSAGAITIRSATFARILFSILGLATSVLQGVQAAQNSGTPVQARGTEEGTGAASLPRNTRQGEPRQQLTPTGQLTRWTSLPSSSSCFWNGTSQTLKPQRSATSSPKSRGGGVNLQPRRAWTEPCRKCSRSRRTCGSGSTTRRSPWRATPGYGTKTESDMDQTAGKLRVRASFDRSARGEMAGTG